MTDIRTHELREKLRELDIKFATDDFGDLLTTIWWADGMVDGIFAKYLEGTGKGCWCEDDPVLKIRMRRITPEQAIAATLGNGTLTAEQVREAIERHSAWVIGNNRCFHDGAYEEIADELNAKLGSEVHDDWR